MVDRRQRESRWHLLPTLIPPSRACRPRLAENERRLSNIRWVSPQITRPSMRRQGSSSTVSSYWYCSVERVPGARSRSSGSQCRLTTSWLGAPSSRRRRRKTKGAITRSTGRPRASATTSSRAPRRSPSPARSRPVSSRVSRTAVAARSASWGSLRPPGKPMCPDHGSFSCSARRMKSSSRPAPALSRRTSATAARGVSPGTRRGEWAESARARPSQPITQSPRARAAPGRG